jgi:hypothetical protein
MLIWPTHISEFVVPRTLSIAKYKTAMLNYTNIETPTDLAAQISYPRLKYFSISPNKYPN